jgi:pyruvate/2-oxoglutarate dehydrogenase complex dihydrolipoamide dehydrogenase (E3) component/uncharacterized membrane protein YdjX (TVP38/TMEM64 family)
MRLTKLLFLLALVLLVAAFFYFDLSRWFSLSELKQRQDDFSQYYHQHPVATLLAFFASYVLVTALSLPAASLMTLAAGALFGLPVGTAMAVVAATCGATLAMLTSRYLLRNSIQQRFGSRLQEVNAGMARDGALYLFSLRLIPLMPFFLLNLLMGLSNMPVWTYFWVSLAGMLAGTAAYVNAGTQLAQISSLGGILSPGLIGSFALLGVLPLILKKLLHLLRRRRVYARWQHLKPRQFERNLVVIGGGAGGLVSAYIGAAVKAKVTLVESHKMGGDCLNFGCVPSKALIKSAKLAHQMRHAHRYGLSSTTPEFSFRAVMQRVQDVIAAIAPHDSVQRYTDLGVQVLQGHARIVTPWSVEVRLNDGTTQVLTTRAIIIAAGARPLVPPLPGLDDVGYVTSDTLWNAFAQLERIPARMVVLGGGPIGCELAQSFARLGSQVTQVEMAERIMIREDAEVSALAKASLQADGVRVLTGHKAVRCVRVGERKQLMVASDGQEQVIEFDELVCAVGRVARLTGYGLEELGIPTERTVLTNEYLETVYPNIFAVGDVAGPYQFTHTAAHQAWYASVNALFGNLRRFKANYTAIPWTTFIDPEVARVGLSEQDARDKGIPYEVTRYDLDDLDRAIADSETQGFVKVLTMPGRDTILGVTIVGTHAGDLLAEYVLAMTHGLGLNKILGTIHTYPTLAEANKYAAGEWKRQHQPERLLQWVARYHAWRRNR